MFKKVFILILSIVSLTYLFFFSGFFSLNLNPTQSESLFFATKIYLFSALTCFLIGEILNWSIAGCVLLVILFYNSAKFSEEISAAKYPKYKEYQMNVPMFLGRFKSNWKD